MKIIFSWIFICSSFPLFATSITNQELVTACKDKSATTQNFCYGFIIGAANAAQFYRNIVDVTDEYIDICFPKEITNKEIVDIYTAWVEKNPSVLSSPAFIGVSTSFSLKYSCLPKEKEKSAHKKPKESFQKL
ncbi:MAG TPA: Rap1a/Tai family immunity protein [Alphaproteobacteria bacterium]|nr:Rap1a/Tai family immunity protein [Alphaproteobacteria bacterium]